MDKTYTPHWGAFEWDDNKDASNRRKHHISFVEAAEVFADPNALFLFDEEHSEFEDRYLAIGSSSGKLLLLVVFTERQKIRIVSARELIHTEGDRHYVDKYRIGF